MTNESRSSETVQRIDYSTYLDERRTLVSSELDVAGRFDKSILTLSGGALLLSMTFVKDIASKPHNTWTLFISWLLLAIAISSMLVSLLTSQSALRCQRDLLDETLERQPQGSSNNRLGAATHRLNIASIVVFIAALSFLSVFIYVNMPGE